MWGVVVNPISGRGKGAIYASKVIEHLTLHNLNYEVITGINAITTAENLREFLQRSDPITGIISVGGDGLAHLVIQQCATTTIPVAFIPAGTGNDLVRTLGWHKAQLRELLDIVITQKPTSMDLGLADGEWFAAILSTGFDSIVNERANRLKWPKGPSKYNLALAMELPLFNPRHYRLTLDNEVIETQAMLVGIGNGNSYGGGMLVCPDADVSDNLLDVVLLTPISKFEFIRVFPRVYKGTHISHPAVKVYRSAKVIIEAEAVAYADGERIGSLPIHAESVPQALLTWRR